MASNQDFPGDRMIVFTSHLQRDVVVVKFCGIAIGILLHPKKLENGKASCKPFKDLLIHFGFFLPLTVIFLIQNFHSEYIPSWVNLLGYQIFSVLRGPPLRFHHFFFESPLTMEVHSFHRDVEIFPSKVKKKKQTLGSDEWTDS